MKRTESVPCVCGRGLLEIEVTRHGHWTVEVLIARCLACNRAEITEARARAEELDQDSESSDQSNFLAAP